MKKVLLMFLMILFCFPFIANAHEEESEESSTSFANELEFRNYVHGSPSVKVYLEQELSDSLSLSVTVSHQRGWDELTTGPVYYVTKDISVGLAVGVSRYMSDTEEKRKNHATLSSFIYMNNDVWEGEILVEKYARDPSLWYEAHLERLVTDNISLGVYAEKSIGWGPRISYSVNDRVRVWASPIVDRTGETTALFGLQIAF